MGFTYKEAGVDIDAAERLVKRIKDLARTTFPPQGSFCRVIGGIGGFSGMYAIDFTRFKEPLLVSACDGVGTKLKVASMLERFESVGIDLVAMCVNDLVTCGAEPLFFLDYIATEKLNVDVAEQVIKSIIEGCRDAGCALLGGETAEMPGVYKEGEFDLAGFAVGIVDKDKIIDASTIKPGDHLIGLASSGLHSNGFSLVRKILGNEIKMYVDELLIPTKIYSGIVLKIKDQFVIKGIAHITGGGIPGNLSRILPKEVDAVIKEDNWEVPPFFKFLEKRGKIDREEMFRVFNMGIGMILVVDSKDSEKIMSYLGKIQQSSYLIGQIIEGSGKVILKE
jgi:phosphoribosylformylglycinamidine cyclo-ligase